MLVSSVNFELYPGLGGVVSDVCAASLINAVGKRRKRNLERASGCGHGKKDMLGKSSAAASVLRQGFACVAAKRKV